MAEVRIDQTKIVKFLSQARTAVGYESLDEGKETLLANGTRVLGPFEQGNLSYQDSYRGFETFSGKELILHKGKAVWRRFYTGGIIDKTLPHQTMDEIYMFLRSALAHFPKSHPECRGPDRYEKGLFEYLHNCEGTFEKFKGEEEIYWKGKKVYELTYHG